MGKFLTTAIGSALRVFVGLVLGGFVLYLSNGGSLSGIKGSDLMTWVSAALVVAVPILIAAVNPADQRFGKKS